MQARAGTRERMAQLGPQVMRSLMPEQHRAFYPLLPFVALGAHDETGRPWATLLAGRAGFVSSPDPTRLRVEALPPPGDPLVSALHPGARFGLLGIQLETRRRNRANGVVAERDARGLTLHVEQSFGNCPKYIQRRDALPVVEFAAATPARRGDRLDAASAALARAADTFFIATHAANGACDVSHRGGRPGFARVDRGGRALTWPDFAGNGFFNTLGNIAAAPEAALVFPDFADGTLLHVAGRAEIAWDGAALDGFAGAERLVRLAIDHVVLRPQALPLRWRLVETSPVLEGTGVW